MLRILHIINNLPVGGAERFLVLLATAQRQLGLEAHVCALGTPNPLAADLEARRVPLIEIGRQRLNDPRLFFDVWRRIRALEPDVVHTHLFYADTVGRLAARSAGVRALLSTEHSTEGLAVSRKRLLAMRFTARFVDRLVAVSEPVRQATAARLGIEPGRIEVVPNGIELAAWQEPRRLDHTELGVPADALLVGAHGRLDHPKGYDVLIEAIAVLHDPRVHLLLAGDGPLRSSLAALAAARGVEAQVHWLGFRADVARFLATLDVFTMPSRWEGHSMALMEAMATGRAIVASDIEAITSVAADAALQVPVGDAAALAAALRRVLDDGGLRARLGRQALDRVQACSIEVSAARYAAIYEAILRTPRAARMKGT